MMHFPITELLSEEACYAMLLSWLHPQGLHCPHGHPRDPYKAPHTKDRMPIVNYRCSDCGAVYNLFTNTALCGIHYDCRVIVLLLRGFCQGVPHQHLARELSIDRGNVTEWFHRLATLAQELFPPQKLPDLEVETDEMFQNAGEKGIKHADPADPPRRRANKQRGHGTFENDRPPIVGSVGRDTGQIACQVVEHTDKKTLHAFIETTTQNDATVFTDEWPAYAGIKAAGRLHKTVCHSAGEYGRDEDGDGFCEVHTNTIEGDWVGLRNYLRPFRGVSKWFLDRYVAFWQAMHNFKLHPHLFLRRLLGPSPD